MNIIDFLKDSVGGKISIEKQEDFLKEKTNITAKELAIAVRYLIKEMPIKLNLKGAIDVCGTGGSGLERINTSTISAFILTSLGIKVAKHGNKAASGRFGSFDLLEKLDIEFLDEKKECERTARALSIEKQFKNTNLAFLYARNFHPVMRHFAEARKRIGKPTFFNLLGPLLNPANTKCQIIGTTFRDKMQLIAETCKLIGKKRVYIVCGEDGLDEITLTGKTFVTELNNGKIKNYTISPKDFGVKPAKFSEIKGGTPEENTKLAIDILAGKCKSRHLDLVLVNSALALKLCDKVENLRDGYKLAKKAVHQGMALKKYEQMKIPNILNKIINDKKINRKNLGTIKIHWLTPVVFLLQMTRFARLLLILALHPRAYAHGFRAIGIKKSDRNFYAAIKSTGISLIAEIKPKSPSKGILTKKNFSVEKMAKQYEKSGASAISVLCDKKYFGGDIKNIQKAHNATNFIPLLCKDFIIDEYQIKEARKYGADAILLIAAILSKEKIVKFTKLAESFGMDVLCEVHNLTELEKVLDTNVKIIGINNRDLKTFKIDLETTSLIAKHIPKTKLIVSESGIYSKNDIKALPGNIDAVLVGTALMQGLSPQNIATKKLKVCGVRDVKIAQYCEKIGVDFIGLNFVPSSKRRVSEKEASAIVKHLKNTKSVGIFQNQNISYVNKIAKKLDFIQLSGEESIAFIKKCQKPVIKTISVRGPADIKKAEKYYPYVEYIIFDGPNPGSGKPFKKELLKNYTAPFFLSGGISPENIDEALKYNPLGIDTASGIETNGKIDVNKIELIFNQIKSC